MTDDANLRGLPRWTSRGGTRLRSGHRAMSRSTTEREQAAGTELAAWFASRATPRRSRSDAPSLFTRRDLLSEYGQTALETLFNSVCHNEDPLRTNGMALHDRGDRRRSRIDCAKVHRVFADSMRVARPSEGWKAVYRNHRDRYREPGAGDGPQGSPRRDAPEKVKEESG